MINPNVHYSVTGRYMDGQKIIGYHLVGEDGSQSQESKDRVIYLIKQDIITNMRVQTGPDGDIILRGKGINLNKLPVYDPNKDKYRNTESSQTVANTHVSTKNSTVQGASPMGQYTIVRRIMFKSQCLGYELRDHSGQVIRKKRADVIKLAAQRLISNAIAQRYTREGSGTTELILRGQGCDLNKLPILIVNEQGKIVDPTKDTSGLTVRSAYMKHSGVIIDTIHDKKVPFKAGDFIICGPNGEILIKDRGSVEREYRKDTESQSAVCDDYLSITKSYFIEVFGNKPIQLSDQFVRRWIILKPAS